jgi:glutamate dehydrogenase (NADP+)
MRPEATGYGAVYFAGEMLNTRGESIAGKTCLVSGSGNVAQFAVQKLIALGARVVTMSDSSGYILDEAGIDDEKLEFVMELKNVRRGRIAEFAERFPTAHYTAVDPTQSHNPIWTHMAACAFPCATQNEVNATDAKHLIDNGVYVVSEGANMPTTAEGVEMFLDAKLLYGPGKAANAGGVAVSGLEMAQNSMRYAWTKDEVDQRLKVIMSAVHEACLEAAARFGAPGNYVHGANIAGFLKVADSMLDQGIV